ncbi:hypothetical protein Tco_1174512 [Tanacetum coccineum]
MKILLANQKVSTDKEEVSTDRPDEGTVDHNEGRVHYSESSTTTTHNNLVIGDRETRPTSTRLLLTLKPLPKIDPKDKIKKKIEEEDESDTESEEEEVKKLAKEEATKAAFSNEYDFIQARLNDDKILAKKLQEEEREISEAIKNKPPSRNQLRNQMMTYLKHVGGKKHSDLKGKTFEEIHVLYERLKRKDQNFVAIGSAEDERQIKELNKDPEKKKYKKRVVNEEDTVKVPAEQEVTEQEWEIVRWRLYEAYGVCILEFKEGTIIYMLVKRRYPLSKELLQQMLDLGLEVEEESIVALQ